MTVYSIFSSYKNVVSILANNGMQIWFTTMSLYILANSLRLHTKLKKNFIQVMSVVNKWLTEFPPALPVTLSNFLSSLSIIPPSPPVISRLVFLASDKKSARSVECYWHLISHLQASRWGTRWPTYQAQNKPRHTVTLLRMIFLPLEFVCHFG